MMTRRTVLGRAAGLAVLAGLLVGAPAAAVSYGRITFTQMSIDNCEDMFGSCEWRLTCRTGGGPDTEIVANQAGGVAQDFDLAKSFEVKSFPAKVDCTLFEDDGWFGETWNEAGKASLDLPGGGDYTLEIKGDQGAVVVKAAVDSFEMPDSLAAPAAAKPAAKPAKGKKTATQYVAGYVREPIGHGVVLGLPWDAFKARVDAFAAKNVKLVKMHNWDEGGQRLWGGIFRTLDGNQELVVDLPWEPFVARWKPFWDQGMHLNDFEIVPKSGKFYFTGVYNEGSGENPIWVQQDRNEFIGKWNQISGGGLRLVDLELYQSSGTWYYAGIFRGGSGPYGMKNALTWDDLQTYWQGKEREGRTSIVDLAAYNDGGKELWDIAMGAGQGQMTPKLDAAAFAKDWNDRVSKGFRLTALETP
jgi:hypothetical protein